MGSTNVSPPWLLVPCHLGWFIFSPLSFPVLHFADFHAGCFIFILGTVRLSTLKLHVSRHRSTGASGNPIDVPDVVTGARSNAHGAWLSAFGVLSPWGAQLIVTPSCSDGTGKQTQSSVSQTNGSSASTRLALRELCRGMFCPCCSAKWHPTGGRQTLHMSLVYMIPKGGLHLWEKEWGMTIIGTRTQWLTSRASHDIGQSGACVALGENICVLLPLQKAHSEFLTSFSPVEVRWVPRS